MKQKQNRTKQMKKYLKKRNKEKASKAYRQKHNICMHRNTVKTQN